YRRDRTLRPLRADARLDRAARQQIEGVGGLSFAHDDLTRRVMRVHARTDQARDVDAVEVAKEFDAAQQLLLGGDLVNVLGGVGHGAGGSTRNTRQLPGTPLSSWAPRSANERPEPATRSRTVLDTRISSGPARLEMRAPMWTAMPAMPDSIRSSSPV